MFQSYERRDHSLKSLTLAKDKTQRDLQQSYLMRAVALANRSAVVRSLHLESSSNAPEAQLNCNKEFN